jgi:hypothetical protein
MMKEICGPKQSESLWKSSQGMLSLKTSLVCYLKDRKWMKAQGNLFHTLEQFSETYPKQGMMQNGKLYLLPMSERVTSEKGCGLWRTPTAGDGYHGGPNSRDSNGSLHLSAQVWQTPTADDAVNRKIGKFNSRGEPKLSAQVKMWLTPTKEDCKMDKVSAKEFREFKEKGLCPPTRSQRLRSQVAMWPTPAAASAEQGMNEWDGRRGQTLIGAAKSQPWPTPTSQMGKHADPTLWEIEHQKGKGRHLHVEVGGQLNPDWVEWLLGWPIGWSSLEPIEKLRWEPLDREPLDIPRVAMNIKDRVNRLKAIGNGQCPKSAATAWKILK